MRAYLILILAAATSCISGLAGAQEDAPTTGTRNALTEYVQAKDETYEWKIVDSFKGNRVKTYLIQLTSQTWRAGEVDRQVWSHWLLVNRPDSLYQDTALLMLSGGSNEDAQPSEADPDSRELALNTGSVTSVLFQVPNQPLTFNDDEGRARVEDEIIALSWDRYLRTSDETWPAQLPMVKSAVRAMDAVQEFMMSEEGGKFPVKDFVVAGASKRGWAAWLTAAADRRVLAVIPLVIDVLNTLEATRHHFAAYGFYAPALKDYEDAKIMERMDTPEAEALMGIIDPYAYLDKLKIPKLIINAAGDQFFPPDTSRLYFGDLLAPKFLRYVPNADHSLEGANIKADILGFYRAVMNDLHLPQFEWDLEPGGTIRVFTRTKPREVNLWQADNAEARDFRLDTIGASWIKSTLPIERDGIYRANPGAPPKGWRAYFVELVFESTFPEPYVFTTDVNVAPDILPFATPDDDQPTTGTEPVRELDDAVESAAAPGN